MRPAERLADAVLPFDVARHGGPSVQPDALGLDRLPDIDERMPHHQRVSTVRSLLHCLGDP
ncbi:Uncharacterised protein [Mycobacteroides abscessus subsp. abscessus]|nr:Uncharacterised protein [Mycobacteroides abscessus subsp. abscessus]